MDRTPRRRAAADDVRTESDAQDRGLQLVEPRVVADQLERLLVTRAVEAQHPHPLGDLVVAGRDAPPSPNAPRFLDGKNENVAAGLAQRARPASEPDGGCVLQHRHPSASISATRRDVAEQVTNHARARRESPRARARRRHAERLRVDVAEHRSRAGQRDRLRRGVERERRHDDLVAGPHPHRAKSERDRVRPVRHPDRVPGAHVGRELGLEGADLGTEDEAAAVDHLRQLGVDLGPQRLQGRRVSKEGPKPSPPPSRRSASASAPRCAPRRCAASRRATAAAPRARARREGPLGRRRSARAPSRTQLTKCSSRSASGSTFESRGLQMSPERVMYSP